MHTFTGQRRKMLLRELLCVFAFLYVNVVSVSCEEGISLAFAIDDTRSMWDEIEQVKHEAKAIMDVVLKEKFSQIKEYVLVTINDPDAVLRANTTSPEVFQSEINKIRVHNFVNMECEEMSLTGIEKALVVSRPGSYLYVFTDASSKDYYKVEAIKSLCQKKQIPVVFVLTGDCGNTSDKRYRVYHEIAAASSGQVFHVRENQVHSVLQTIKILLRGTHSIITWKLIPPSYKYQAVEFTIDEKSEYAVISTSGTNVYLYISSTKDIKGPTPKSERIMWNDKGKVLRLVQPRPGKYFAWVKGDSVVSVVVYARTDFTFDHGFSVLEPLSMKDTSKQPIAGREQHLSINVTDPQHSVEIKSVQILDMYNNDKVIQELPLWQRSEELYITDPFLFPKNMFKVAVNGVIKTSRQPIKRFSKTIISQNKIAIPDTQPEVTIDAGTKLEVNYGADATLKCTVTAYPEPKIEWFTAGGALMSSNNSAIEDALYVSYLKLKDVKNTEVYTCKATNRKGVSSSKTEVATLPIFTTISIPTANTTVKYGQDVVIPCNIRSHLPMKVKWFRSGKELGSSGVYSISADGLNLTLKHIDLIMQGTYTCEASLISDPTVKQTHETKVEIPGLARPKITSTNRNINIKKLNKLELDCRSANAYPKPQVIWFKKNGKMYKVLAHETSDVLIVPNAQLTDAGQYKCVSKNIMGSNSAEFVVTVGSQTEIGIVETKRTFLYGSDAQFTCQAYSNPPPTLVWRDEYGNPIPNQQVTKINEFEFINRLTLKNVKKSRVYYCEVTNDMEQVTEFVRMTVPYPFVLTGQRNDASGMYYGASETFPCHIKSALPVKIQWYRENNGVKSSRTLIHSSEKLAISEDGTELKIKFMDLDMVGKYTCEASLLSDPKEKVAYSIDVTIVGLIGPKILFWRSVTTGNNFTAICRVIGFPKPTITWHFKPKGSDLYQTIPGSKEELNIVGLKINDTGIYKCVAKNTLGEIQREFEVDIEGPPVITNVVTSYFAVEGDQLLTIPCNVTGAPYPDIVWKIGENIIKTNPKYVIEGNVLHIKNPLIADKSFTCEAKNKLGSVTKTFSTEVTDIFENDPRYYGEINLVNAKINETATIKCNLVNSDTQSVRWYLNGIKMSQTGSTYKVQNVYPSDEGNYTCRVDTVNDVAKSETYVLNIVFLGFKNDLPSFETIDWREEDDVLDCNADSNPKAKVEWWHNGEKIESLNDIEETPVNDWGEFTCKLSNVYGSIQRTFTVTTTGCYISKYQASKYMPLATKIETPTWLETVSNGDMLLETNEEIQLWCPDTVKSSNAFNITPSNEINVKCLNEDKFIVNEKIYRYKELQCKKEVEPSVVTSNQECAGPHTQMIRVGFPVNGFFEAYKVCYDTNKNVPLYANASNFLSKHVKNIDISQFVWNSTSEVGGAKVSGSTCEKSDRCCYSKIHLVDWNQLPFGPAQSAAFKDNLNSIAVWNPCDGSGRVSWHEFENVSKSVMSYYETISSWNGASEYVQKNDSLVPRYLWKVMSKYGKSIVIVYVNDKSPLKSDKRCTKPCEWKLEVSIDGNVDKFLHCCNLDEFSQVFDMPSANFETLMSEQPIY